MYNIVYKNYQSLYGNQQAGQSQEASQVSQPEKPKVSPYKKDQLSSKEDSDGNDKLVDVAIDSNEESYMQMGAVQLF